MDDFLHAFSFIYDNRSFVLHLTWKHLELSGAAVALSVLTALPLGVWLGHIRRGSFLAINGSNLLRALPSLALIAIGLPIFGFGFVDSMVALTVLAFPLILTNAYVAIASVDRDAVEAARGMGMTPLQVALKVELPLSIPLIFAGIRTAIVYVIATATITSVAGGTSLGDIVFNQASYRLSGVIGASICVGVAALLIAEVLFALIQRQVTPRGLRAQRGITMAAAAPVAGPVAEPVQT